MYHFLTSNYNFWGREIGQGGGKILLKVSVTFCEFKISLA